MLVLYPEFYGRHTVGKHKGRKVAGHEGGGALWIAHFPNEHLSIVVLRNLNALTSTARERMRFNMVLPISI
jgi:hypothetical protein